MSLFRCPLCSSPLVEDAQGVACANRHRFDRAKEGYLNLLPVQHKRSREPGDAREQLQARRAFLQAGYFAPLREQLLALLPASAQAVLDIGCGEGYFTSAMAGHLAHARVLGIDIAKEGVRLAARAAQQQGLAIDYAVASSYALPVQDQSIDVVTRIYAPSEAAELLRVLKPDGCLLLVAPGPEHLIRLRQQVYQQVRLHEPPSLPQGFILQEHQSLRLELTLAPGAHPQALLAMTPFAWRMPDPLKQQLAAEGLCDQAEFELFLYRPQ